MANPIALSESTVRVSVALTLTLTLTLTLNLTLTLTVALTLTLARLFPDEIAADARTAPPQPASSRRASLRKFSVVRVPRSVYAAVPGAGKFRPSQETPVHNFVLAGDWSAQKFLGSMEGAVLAGKLASEVVACKAAGVPTPNGGPRVPTDAPVPADAPEAPSAPGFAGESPVAFGGGQTGGLVHP